ncbi:uncharacterized protein METZ01_LOCUS510175, partial [marine metagenome]
FIPYEYVIIYKVMLILIDLIIKVKNLCS